MPCDSGGLSACLYWATHEDSPGITPEWGVQQALALHQEVRAHGWPLVEAFRTLRLSTAEAEALYIRLGWLQDELSALITAYQQGG